MHNAERTRSFAKRYRDRPLRSIDSLVVADSDAAFARERIRAAFRDEGASVVALPTRPDAIAS